MLKSVIIKNFKSILELVLTFEYGESKAPNGYKTMSYMPFLEGGSARFVPVLGMFGSNASGKSTIIQGLRVLKKILSEGHSNTFFLPNRLHSAGDITEFSVTGLIQDGVEYKYSISYDAVQIRSERLFCSGEVLFSFNDDELNFQGLVARHYSQEHLRNIYQVECLNAAGFHTATFLAKIALHYAGLNAMVPAVFQSLTEKLDVYENNRFSSDAGLNMLLIALGKTNDVSNAFSEIETLLRKLDLGISRMEYHPEESGDASESISTFHKDESGKEIRFHFGEESMGTRGAFGLLGVCLAALHEGRVLVIDEIDASLHSLLVSQIIRLFKDRRYNTRNAQLFFSAHNTDLLDQKLLRVSEVGIINKTLKSGTTLRRLCEFEGVRNVTNFRKQYLEGRFSGIPFPYL